MVDQVKCVIEGMEWSYDLIDEALMHAFFERFDKNADNVVNENEIEIVLQDECKTEK